MTPLAIALIAATAILWGIGNRFWGGDDNTDHVPKLAAALYIGLVTAIFLAAVAPGAWLGVAGGLTTAAGFWLGRVTDGIRGSYVQKSLRGYRYAMIYIAMAWLLQSWLPLLPLVFFWQSGPIFWAASRVTTLKADRTALAEFADMTIRGALFLPLVFIACLHGHPLF